MRTQLYKQNTANIISTLLLPTESTSLKQSTTLERLISILGMLFGVISFTFVVSNINSILSEQYQKRNALEKNIMSLETLQKKYNFSEDLFHLSRKQIKMKMTSNTFIDDMESFLKVFPKNLKNDLQISMYGERLGQIDIFHGLNEETIISIGRKLTKIIYLKGTLSFYNIQTYFQSLNIYMIIGNYLFPDLQ